MADNPKKDYNSDEEGKGAKAMDMSKIPQIADAFYRKFEGDDEVYAHYQRIGENLHFRGDPLRSFVTDHVKEYKDMWKKHVEQKYNIDFASRQKEIQELRLAEREMDTTLQKTHLEMEEKKRQYEREMEERKIKHEKEMKEIEISLERKRLEEQTKQRKFEESEKEKQRQHEENQRRRERKHQKSQQQEELLERKRQRKHQERMLKHEIAARQKNLEEEVKIKYEKKDSFDKKNLPKMSIFKPEQDDVDAFINRFELMANQLEWQRENWGLYLSSYLDGDALSLFNYLIKDGCVNYETLKKELLFKFKCDAEGFHERFRNGVPAVDESFNAYYTRLAGLFTRWLSLKNVGRDFDALFDFMIVEQMLAGCCKDLRVHLKERRLVKSADIIEEANSYREARANRDVAKKGAVTLSGSSQVSAAAATGH